MGLPSPIPHHKAACKLRGTKYDLQNMQDIKKVNAWFPQLLLKLFKHLNEILKFI
jgi:hypothetical protein